MSHGRFGRRLRVEELPFSREAVRSVRPTAAAWPLGHKSLDRRCAVQVHVSYRIIKISLGNDVDRSIVVRRRVSEMEVL